MALCLERVCPREMPGEPSARDASEEAAPDGVDVAA